MDTISCLGCDRIAGLAWDGWVKLPRVIDKWMCPACVAEALHAWAHRWGKI